MFTGHIQGQTLPYILAKYQPLLYSGVVLHPHIRSEKSVQEMHN